jgi:hypothetical protein
MRVNAQSAQGKPDNTSHIGLVLAVLRYLCLLIWSRVSGKYRMNPFLSGPGGKPRVEPRG